MLSSNCGIQISKCGDFSKSCSAESPEKMSSVNDGKPAFKRSESYWRRARKPVIAFSAMFAVSVIGTLPAQAAEHAELSSGAKPVQAEVLDFAGRLAEAVKKSIGAKCDQLAGDPEDPQKSGAGVPFKQLDSAAAIEACNRAVQVSPLARYQYQLGNAFDKAEKHSDAIHWYRKAAEQGYAISQINIGAMYIKGQGVAEDYVEAMKWFRMAAEQGRPFAQSAIGSMYRDGQGVAQDYTEAMKWLRMAAEQGDGPAQNDVGSMYLDGTGVAQDYAEAMKWYRKAADQGEAMAQSNIGRMYVNGQGVAKDYAEAGKWFRLAAAQGDIKATHELGKLEEQAKLEASFSKVAENVTSSIVRVLKYDITRSAKGARELAKSLRASVIYPEETYGCSSLEHGTPVLTSVGTMSGGGFGGDGFNGRTLPAAVAQVEYLCVNRALGTKEKGIYVYAAAYDSEFDRMRCSKTKDSRNEYEVDHFEEGLKDDCRYVEARRY